MSRLPAASLNSGLDAWLVPGTVYYLSFNTADPGTTGASEWTGGRQAITFSPASAGVKVNGGTDSTCSFASIPAEAGGLPYYSIWTASSGGSYVGGGTTSGISGALSVGSTMNVAAGAVSWTAT